MIRLIIRFAILVLLAAAFAWMADRPGSLSITWLGYQIDEIPIYLVIGVLLLGFFVLWFTWWMIRVAFGSPGALGDFFRMRRNRKGLNALSKGMVAVGAGDIAGAQRQAIAAQKLMADSPLAHLLEAQSAQMRGDEPRVRDIYTQMLGDPETELVALRGLYSLARKSGDDAAARRHAQRALKRNPALAWASEAMTVYHSSEADWPAVATLIDSQRKAGIIDRDEANANRAVVLTAQALAAEPVDADAAADLAAKAHKLDPSLIPAAVVAGRVFAEQGSLRKSSKILEATWKLNPHPDIAEVYRHARMGDSTTDRLARMRDLLATFHGDQEGAVALATAAIEAHDWKTARNALAPYCQDRPQARICSLMAELEDGEFGDRGRAREWLARAVRAPAGPAWTADGYTSPDWLPVSPTTGQLGAFNWKVPLAALSYAAPDEAIEIMAPALIEEPEEVIEIAAQEVPEDQAEPDPETPAEPVEPAEPAEPIVEEVPDTTEADPEPEAAAEEFEEAGEVEQAVPETTQEHEPIVVAEAEPEAPAEAPPEPEAEEAVPATINEQPDRVDLPTERAGDAADPVITGQPDDPGPRKTAEAQKSKGWFG